MTTTLNKAMTEDELLIAITEAATHYGWLWTHHRRSDRAQLMGDPGFPDLVLVKGRRLLLLELKTERGRVTAGQQRWMDRFKGGQHMGYVIRPSDLDKVLMWLGS